MAQSLPETIEIDFLTCPVCLDIYKNPKILECLHTFCYDCLSESNSNSQKEDSNVICPLCRETSNSKQSLKTNFYINGLLDVFRSKYVENEKCAICYLNDEDQTATSKCLQCGDYLCQKCSKKHNFTRLSVSHKVVSLKDLHSGKFDKELRELQEIPCKEHVGEVMRFFCITCGILVCRDCVLLEHKSHECLKPEQALKSKRPHLDKLVKTLEEKLQGANHRSAEIKHAFRTLSAGEEKAVQHISASADQLISQIRKEKSRAIERISTSYKTRKETVDAIQVENDAAMDVTQKTLNFCKAVLSDGKEMEILSLEALLRKHLDQLQKTASQVGQLDTRLCLDMPSLAVKNLFNEASMLDIFTVDGNNQDEKDVDNKTQWRSDEDCGSPNPTREGVQKEKPKRNKAKTVHRQPISIKLLRKFNTRLPGERTSFVSGVAMLDEDRVIVSDEATKALKIFTKNGKFKMLIRLDDQPRRIAVCNKRIIVTTDSSLRILDSEGNWNFQEPIKATGKSFPVAKVDHVKDAFIIANTDECDEDCATLRNVHDGERIADFKFNTRGVLPIYIEQNNNGTLIVSDWNGDCVRLINTEGRLTKTFRPQLSSEAKDFNKKHNYRENRWRPGDVCSTPRGNICICDYDENKLVLLWQNGTFMKDVMTEDVHKPRACACDAEGNIFVTGKSGVLAIYSVDE